MRPRLHVETDRYYAKKHSVRMTVLAVTLMIFFSSCSSVYTAPTSAGLTPTPAATATPSPTLTPAPTPTPSPSPSPSPTPVPTPLPGSLPVIEGLDTSFIPADGLAASDAWTGPVAYLTFDDGPCIKETPWILSILDAYGIKATFFLVGQYINGDTASILTAINEHGHSIGNHTTDHLGVYQGLEHFKESVSDTEKKIKKYTGITSRLFRYPGGSNVTMVNRYFAESRQFLADQGMVFYDWSTTCGDGNNETVYTPEELCGNVMKYVGSQKTLIVLMHDSHSSDTERGRNLLQAIPLIIRRIYEKGYRFSPITPDTHPVQFRKF